MKVKAYIESLKGLSLESANIKIFNDCGVSNFLETLEDIQDLTRTDFVNNHKKDEYGDWQTNLSLALSICENLKTKGISPEIIIEPTCGKGNFILAALLTFSSIKTIYGIELYKPYIKELKIKILEYALENKTRKLEFQLFHQNVFDFYGFSQEYLSISNLLRYFY